MERQKNKLALVIVSFLSIIVLNVALFRFFDGDHVMASVKSETERESESESETEEYLPMEEEEEPIEEAEEEESESMTASESEPEEETRQDQESESEKKEETEKESEKEPGYREETEQGRETKPETEAEDKAAPEEVERGVHYEIRGDDSAWFRDENGLLWLREGTNLYIDATDEGGYNTGTVLEDLREDGSAAFSLKDTDADGIVLRESAPQEESYHVDAEAPVAAITAEGRRQGEVVYAAQSCAVSLSVEPDGKSGLYEVSYKIVPCDTKNDAAELANELPWTACPADASFEISAEGLFRVYVRCVDRVGNVTFTASDLICIDRKEPKIKIKGVKDSTANAGEVRIKVSCKDRYYKEGSLQLSVIGMNSGKVPAVKDSGSDAEGAWIEYFDIPKQLSYDDVYELCATAEDFSGNKAEKKIRFSVNRFGSVYDLSEETRKMLAGRYLRKAQPVTFYETNIDYVGESQIFCRRDGLLQPLKRGSDYSVSMEGNKDSWKRYSYKIPASYFQQEGVYELLLTTEDAAQNESDTGLQKKRVTFVLDYSEPRCSISGVKSGGIYPEESVTARIRACDNSALKQVKIYHNSELVQESRSGQEEEEELCLELDQDDDWQTLQVWLCDMAGNEHWSEEIPVFVGDAAEVPPYQKKRLSAKELALGKEETKDADTELKSASVGIGGPDAPGRGEKDAGDRPGTLFLAFGFLAFAGAAVFVGAGKKHFDSV